MSATGSKPNSPTPCRARFSAEEVVSKTFNRAQAKAYQDERRQREQDEQHKRNVRAELEVLSTFRTYMQRERPTATTLGCLIGAIDAYAEQLTGSSHALWAGSRDARNWWDE
jgi:hypothetical protein